MDIAIHTNFKLAHQIRYAEHLKSGFAAHGLKADITESPTQPADVHVVLGPHYAKHNFIGHPRTLLLDRAYYKKDPENVSLGWMRKDGGRHFRIGNGREKPRIGVCQATSGHIFLADYNGPIEQADTIRAHPANGGQIETLEAALRRHRVAIGYATTALVTAGIMGLEVICKDPRNIMSEPNWLDLLPYADWHYTEIENGTAWEHLRRDIDTS